MVALQVIDVITASTNDMGPLSLDYFRKNNFSTSWKVGVDNSVVAHPEVRMCAMLLLLSFPFEICSAEEMPVTA